MSVRDGTLSRRAAVSAGGALVVSFALGALPAEAASFDGSHVRRRPGPFGREISAADMALPGSLKFTPMLDAWLRIDARGVTVFTGKAELGQGIKTALIQVAAEELAVEPAAITLVTADTARTPNEGYTAGSLSMQDSGTAIMNAAAQAREILIGLAAKRLRQPERSLKAERGAVEASDGRRVSYADLLSRGTLHRRARPHSQLGDPAHRRYMDRSWPRVDIPAKVFGESAFVQDLRLPRMVHARVVFPPSYGARLVGVETEGVRKLPGVLHIVRDGSFLAVVAEREYQAIVAMEALSRAARWKELARLPKESRLFADLTSWPSRDVPVVQGDPRLAPGRSSNTNRSPSIRGEPAASMLEAEYRRGYIMHGAIGPSCAVALFDHGELTVWTHSQGVYPLRSAVAGLLHLPEHKVRCIQVEGAGCYGHNGADDAAADAALIARATPGRPVRVQWMRADENAWEPYGSAMLGRLRGALSSGGDIASWEYDVWSNTHSTRPGGARELLPAWYLEHPLVPPPPRPLPMPAGGGDRNSIPLYRIARKRVNYHFVPRMPLRVSALRSLGGFLNVFAIESFIDELARSRRLDSVALRLRHLEDPRALDVVRAAARRFDWDHYHRRDGRGRGFAFARYKNMAAYAAIAIEASVDHESGVPRVLRAVAAVDSGEAVNPDGIRNQIEGGIIQALSWTLFEQVTFDRTRITSRDWARYPILRFADAPESMEVIVLNRPGEPFLGTGEAAQGPAAAALANAIADAVGARVRELPITPERIKAALLHT